MNSQPQKMTKDNSTDVSSIINLLRNSSDISDIMSEDTHGSYEKSNNLIINYLPIEFDENALQQYFGRFGHILERKVMRDKKTRKSLGYGFVRYATHEEAERAISECNGVELLEKRIKVSFARPACDDIKDCKLFVTNIPPRYTENDCLQLFNPFGRIIECRVVSSSTHKIVAFIQFDRKSQAKKAVEAMHGYIIAGQITPLFVKFASYHKNEPLSWVSPMDTTTRHHQRQPEVYQPLPVPAAPQTYQSVHTESYPTSFQSQDKNELIVVGGIGQVDAPYQHIVPIYQPIALQCYQPLYEVNGLPFMTIGYIPFSTTTNESGYYPTGYYYYP